MIVDLYGVLSVADVTIRIEQAFFGQLKGALHRKIDSFLKSTGIGLSIGAFGISAKLQTSPPDGTPAGAARAARPFVSAGGVRWL